MQMITLFNQKCTLFTWMLHTSEAFAGFRFNPSNLFSNILRNTFFKKLYYYGTCCPYGASSISLDFRKSQRLSSRISVVFALSSFPSWSIPLLGIKSWLPSTCTSLVNRNLRRSLRKVWHPAHLLFCNSSIKTGQQDIFLYNRASSTRNEFHKCLR